MRRANMALGLATVGVLLAGAAIAQIPAGAPASSTGQCKDGSYYSGANKQGACQGHKGVKQWWGPAATASGPPKATPAKSAPAATAAAPPKPAAAPVAAAAKPAGTTGLCKDGTYYSGANKQGACHGHQGVKEWWGPATAATSTAPAPAAMPAPKAAAAPAAMPAQSRPATTPSTLAQNAPAAVAAPGGGAGIVWVNSSTKVYHCPNTEWYGKTKQGQYMSEADATAKGFRADHGKSCH
jgi:hypothetical protein